MGTWWNLVRIQPKSLETLGRGKKLDRGRFHWNQKCLPWKGKRASHFHPAILHFPVASIQRQTKGRNATKNTIQKKREAAVSSGQESDATRDSLLTGARHGNDVSWWLCVGPLSFPRSVLAYVRNAEVSSRKRPSLFNIQVQITWGSINSPRSLLPPNESYCKGESHYVHDPLLALITINFVRNRHGLDSIDVQDSMLAWLFRSFFECLVFFRVLNLGISLGFTES